MSNDLGQIQWRDGETSDAGIQIRKDYYHRKTLIETAKEQYFQPLASVTDMPKHYGKTIKCYHMMPLLDDRNINDQGIDASGATITDGNLYGSSKDIGTIVNRMPTLSEDGGRVNRVGFSRIQLEATLENLGFFTEFTDESLNFDTMDDLYEHFSRELINGANEITEDLLQIDLLNGAGVVMYGGGATTDAEMTGEGSDPSVITYQDLQRAAIQLQNNRTPKQTKIISGSKMTATTTVGAGFLLYIGSELQIQIEKLTDSFGNKAFVPVEQYAYAGDYKKGMDMIHGEIGKIGQFRVIVVPEMVNWAGAGADATASNLGYAETDGKYDIYPMLSIGSEAFTTIGFQTSGKSFKFKIITSMPGEKNANQLDPYGRTGRMAIQWYYATMILRSERILLMKSVAEA